MTDTEVKKKRGCGFWLLVVFAAFVGLSIIGAIFGPTEEERAEMQAEREAQEKVDAETKKASAREWYDTLLAVGKNCDEAHTKLSTQFGLMAEGRADRYTAYALASSAQEACQANWLAFGDLETDSLPDAAQEKADEAIETCKMIYYSKKEAAEKMMEFLDGDTRPSIIAGIKEDADFAQSATLRCAVQGIEVLHESGIKLDEMAEEYSEEGSTNKK